MNRFLAILVAISLVCIPLFAETTAQLGGMDSSGNYYWTIDDDGTLIGATGAEISLGGEEKSTWGSIISPMTDQDGYTTTTDAGSKLKLHDDGDLTLGGAVATDVAITFDNDAYDYYIANNNSENELQIGYGSIVGTTEQISIKSDATIVLGEDTDVDFGLIFQSGAQDFYMGIDYTGGEEEDLLCMGLGSTIGATPELAIGKALGAVYVNALDVIGAADLDVGSDNVTDITMETDGGIITIDGTIAFPNADIISNATDDTIRVSSNDLDTILEVYTPYDTTGDATLKLSADLGDEANEQWTITSTGDGNDLVIGCDTSSSGTPVTQLTVADGGVVTTINYIDSKITDTSTNSVVDVMKLTHDGGTAATGVGTGLVFQVDDAGGIEEQASIDVALTTVTDGSEDADIIFRQNIDGTITEALRLDADVGLDLVLANANFTLPDDEYIQNDTDDTITIGSNDADLIVSLYSPKTTHGDVTLSLLGDAGADATDRWDVINDTGDGDLIIKCDDTTPDTMVTKFTIAGDDGDVTTVGDVEIIDDMDLVFGTGSDWLVQYDEGVDDQLLFITAGTQAIAVTDPMFEILVGASATPNQQVFGVGRGTQASNTALFTIDEDGDVIVTGDVDITGNGLNCAGDLLVTPTGNEVHIDGGVDIGGTSTIGDNNLNVVGTATIGDVLTLSAELLLSGETVATSSGDPQGTGVADPDKVITFVVTDATGASADLITLANGTANEIKIIILKTDNETTGLILRPASYAGGTEILFEDAGDGCILIYDGTNWSMVANNGGTES